MDPNNANSKTRKTPQYAMYQRENFWKSNDGETPLFNTDPGELEEQAKAKLTQNGWYYASSNAGQSHTHTANRQAFYRHCIIPRMLVDTNKRDTKTRIFGHDVNAPIGFAPVRINKIYHPLGELPVASAAGGLGLPYALSTAGSQPIDNVWHGRAHTWAKAAWARDLWKEISGGKPFYVKGIQSVEDARKSVEYGFDGIVVSNHAGRQVDGAMASLDALEKIAEAVGDKTYIMFDSGIRSASDVFKALALGAQFVFVGRLWIWGLSIMGEAGVDHVMRRLLAELDILMNVAGFTSIEEIKKAGRSALESGEKNYGLLPVASKL
ncbi:FMN-dependent alpha-hydroxy acid dehydrogenase [Lizonia empirigonia]|nr:FMN-dependent alpha-hydroxy acid dehydrogenase [Lizonia empirigonia]